MCRDPKRHGGRRPRCNTESVDDRGDECSEACNGAHLELSRTRRSVTGDECSEACNGTHLELSFAGQSVTGNKNQA